MSNTPHTTLLSQRNAHERDSHIYMDEPTHIYYLDEKPMSISGTGFLHLFFDPFDVKKVTEALAKKAKPGTKYWGKTPDEIAAMWREGTGAGTDMHKNIEDFYNGLLPDADIKNKEQFGIFAKIYPWLKNLNLEPYRTEWIIYDRDYDIAGSIDYVARNTRNGKLWIIDWKRSNGLKREAFGGKCGNGVCNDIPDCNGYHYQLQVSLYKHILEKNYGVEVEHCAVINLHPTLMNPDILMAEDLEDKVQQMVAYWLENKERLLAERNH